MKPKLFLNSTDVADITGYTQRNARNIMGYVRAEKNLTKHQSITIYDFCECFNLPPDVVFSYINSNNFKLLPIDEDALRKTQTGLKQKPPNTTKPPIYSPDFDHLISKPRTIKPKDYTLDELSEEAG